MHRWSACFLARFTPCTYIGAIVIEECRSILPLRVALMAASVILADEIDSLIRERLGIISLAVWIASNLSVNLSTVCLLSSFRGVSPS